MSPEEFKIKRDHLPQTIRHELERDLPIIIGKKAVDFFKEGFDKEGFTDTAIVAWQEVQRRGANGHKVAKGAAGSRKILTGATGDLGESILYTPGNMEVTIHSDKPYSQAQNEGTNTAGRNHNVTIPARPFIKESQELDRIVKEEIERMLGNLLK